MKAPNGKEYISHVLKSEGGNPLTKYVNLIQSAEERRDKYAFCRFWGMSVSWAMAMRDWHWTKINLLLGTLNQQLPLKGLFSAPGGSPGTT